MSVSIKSVHDFPLLAELECLSIQVWDAPLWHITLHLGIRTCSADPRSGASSPSSGKACVGGLKFKTFKNIRANMRGHFICNIPMENGLTHKHMSTRWGCNRPESRPRAASVSLRQMVSPECVQSVGCMRWGVTAPLILQMQTDVWEGVSMIFK